MMILQCFILFGCLALGELIIHFTHIPLPSSILGMLILTLLLQLKVVKLEWVKGLSDFLVANIGFFFVPPGVAIMLYFDIIKAQFWPIVIASAVSTAIVLAVTGWIHQLYSKAEEKVTEKIGEPIGDKITHTFNDKIAHPINNGIHHGIDSVMHHHQDNK